MVMVVVVMVMMMMMMAVERSLPIDHALNGAKLLHVARNSDRTFVIESVLFLGLLQQLHEERVVDVDHWNHKPLLILLLANHHRHTPFRDVFQLLAVLVVVVMEKVGEVEVEVEVEVQVVVVVLAVAVGGDKPHLFESKNIKNSKTPKNQETLESKKTLGKLEAVELGL